MHLHHSSFGSFAPASQKKGAPSVSLGGACRAVAGPPTEKAAGLLPDEIEDGMKGDEDIEGKSYKIESLEINKMEVPVEEAKPWLELPE